MKTIIFSPAGYNLAETTRCISIAKIIKNDFNVIFMSFGGEFETLIEKENFELIKLEPRLTQKKIDYIYKVDQGKAFGYMFNAREVEEQVNSELEIIEKFKPAALVTGFDLTATVTAKISKTPIIWLSHTTWMFDEIFKTEYATYFDMLSYPGLTLLPDKVLLWLSKLLIKCGDFYTKPYNVVLKKNGLPQLKGMQQSYIGDYNLLAEPKSFFELEPPTDNYHYIGPLFGIEEGNVPEEILDMPKDKPVIYFAMGSSGQPKVIAKIIESFASKDFRVIAPVKKLLEKVKDVKIPENVMVFDWLPARKVNALADLSIIHGGIGTVLTAAYRENL